MACLLLAAALGPGCTGPKPWREARAVGNYFTVEEWMLGSRVPKDPFQAEAERKSPDLYGRRSGMAGWLRALEKQEISPKQLASLPSYDGEPHGATVRLTKAKLYHRMGGDRDLVKKYEKDVRFWPAPDGRHLVVQEVSGYGPIDIVDYEGNVSGLPGLAFEGLEPTYRGYPFTFIRWMPDSWRIVCATVHKPEVRGYLFLAKWNINVIGGMRERVAERLVIVSPIVSDWRLIPIPNGASAKQVQPILERLTRDETEWVRDSAREALDRVLKRALRED